MNNENDDNEQINFISHLRTIIILAARKSSSTSDIDIAAVDKVVETTIDFVKNILEQMAAENNSSSFSSFNLINTIQVRINYLESRIEDYYFFFSLIHI